MYCQPSVSLEEQSDLDPNCLLQMSTEVNAYVNGNLPEKYVDRRINLLDMTIAFDWGGRPQTKQPKD